MGRVIKAAILNIRHNGKQTMHTFYVVTLGGDHMLLGMPFLAATNPNIDWAQGKFKGEIYIGTTDAYEWRPNQGSKEEGLFELRGIYPESDDDPYQFTNVEPEDYTFIRRASPETEPSAMNKESGHNSDTCAQVRHITMATQITAEAADKTERPWHELISSECHRYGKVFSEIKAQQFPESRQWDHVIDLKPDAPETLDSKTYPLPVEQQEALDEFLQEHLKKGYIRISQSPYAAPFFFVKKKDGKLRPVQDYRKLNEYTIKNKYPIPLIKELINQLVGKHWFTKFNIRWG